VIEAICSALALLAEFAVIIGFVGSAVAAVWRAT
jgi:hypothetical protein